jgi:membrane associated rhomboid family serine protease
MLMFFPLPVSLRDGRDFEPIPVVNGLLVVINVLIFWIGWHPMVGPGTGILSILTYAFGHASVYHLVGNMFALLVFGTPVNRRLGNGWYLIAYLGAAITLGLFVKLFCPGWLIGASGAIFAVIAIALLLMPSAVLDVYYFALFPVTLITGVLQPPKHWVFWFIRWDFFAMRVWWGLFLVPFLELSGLYWNGWNWTNLGHLAGLVCGVIIVLLLPTEITMRRRTRSVFAGA